jgi:hypothetical protein
MNAITRSIQMMKRAFEATAKTRVNSVLLRMGREKAEEFGYSYDVLSLGTSAWPWRKTPQYSAEKNGIETYLDQLDSFRDSVLNDLRASRSHIEFQLKQNKAAA